MAATAGDSSISDTFNEINHWRHILMDFSMVGMAVGALVATGGASGFLDPIAGWAASHVTGIPTLLGGGQEFLASAFEQAADGVWYTGAETGMDHMDHSMHHG